MYRSFIICWGIYIHIVMTFGLCNAHATFQRVMDEAFQEYFGKFMEIFLDGFAVFGTLEQHVDYLQFFF